MFVELRNCLCAVSPASQESQGEEYLEFSLQELASDGVNSCILCWVKNDWTQRVAGGQPQVVGLSIGASPV